MASNKIFQADEESIEILKLGRIEENVFYLPDLTLERFQYEKVNKILVALGAKWNKKSKGHVFDYPIEDELNKVYDSGIVVDWKKSTDFFYTPEPVVLEMLGLVTQMSNGKFIALEPSAGQGHILDLLKDNFNECTVKCIEQNPMHCSRLREKGYNPINNDFMKVEPFEVDLCIMNPPFTYEMEHIQHAYKFLKPYGQLISIASSGILTKQTKAGKAFKAWFDEVCGYDCSLPQNSFKESGTGVNAQILIIGKEN